MQNIKSQVLIQTIFYAKAGGCLWSSCGWLCGGGRSISSLDFIGWMMWQGNNLAHALAHAYVLA